MAYEVHIIKSKNTWEAKDNPITLNEWIRLVEEDSEMKIKSKFENINPRTGEKISVTLDDAAVWLYKCGDVEYEVPFSYSRGKISVSRPDENVILKMKKIASKLSARVVGDEEEEY